MKFEINDYDLADLIMAKKERDMLYERIQNLQGELNITKNALAELRDKYYPEVEAKKE